MPQELPSNSADSNHCFTDFRDCERTRVQRRAKRRKPANPSPARTTRYASGASTDRFGSRSRNEGRAKPKVSAEPITNGSMRIENSNPGKPRNPSCLSKCEIIQAALLASRMPTIVLMKSTPNDKVTHNSQKPFIWTPVDYASWL